MLTDKIRLIPSSALSGQAPSEEPEDILSSSLAVIFPDDITDQHGDATSSVLYLSPTFGQLELSLADPEGEVHRRLFGHFLWNAGLLLGELIELGTDEEGREWGVQGQSVLELGAGTGLAGIVAGLKGAERVVISDYPAPEVLKNIEANVERNVGKKISLAGGKPSVQGHEWGILNDGFSLENRRAFDRLFVADCLWIPWQHGNLLKSIAWFMRDENSRAWVIAGFHTGRQKMRGFYERDKLEEVGLEVEAIWERNAEGVERSWVEDRGMEDVTERKRWLVVGILRKRR